MSEGHEGIEGHEARYNGFVAFFVAFVLFVSFVFLRSNPFMTSTFRLAIGILVLALSLATLHAQQRGGQPPAAPPEVFCNTMQAGALCPTATISILKLSGPNVQKWLDAVNKYNAAVENATRDLKAETKGFLTPAQQAEIDRWMDKGINPEVNKILASRNATR